MLNRTAARKGFTLIELIVTIVILGILAALAVPAFSAVLERSRDGNTVQAANGVARSVHALGAFDPNTDLSDNDTVQALVDAIGDGEEGSGDVPDNVVIGTVTNSAFDVSLDDGHDAVVTVDLDGQSVGSYEALTIDDVTRAE